MPARLLLTAAVALLLLRAVRPRTVAAIGPIAADNLRRAPYLKGLAAPADRTRREAAPAEPQSRPQCCAACGSPAVPAPSERHLVASIEDLLAKLEEPAE